MLALLVLAPLAYFTVRGLISIFSCLFGHHAVNVGLAFIGHPVQLVSNHLVGGEYGEPAATIDARPYVGERKVDHYSPKPLRLSGARPTLRFPKRTPVSTLTT